MDTVSVMMLEDGEVALWSLFSTADMSSLDGVLDLRMLFNGGCRVQWQALHTLIKVERCMVRGGRKTIRWAILPGRCVGRTVTALVRRDALLT